MKKAKITFLLLLTSLSLLAQSRPEFTIQDSFYAGSSDTLSFWAGHNAGGLVPLTGGNLLQLGIRPHSPKCIEGTCICWDWKIGAAAILPFGDKSGILLDEAKIKMDWKHLSLQAGQFRKETGFAGISISGGDVSYSGNARSFPGYSVSLDEWSPSFLKGILAVSGSWGDFLMTGPRAVKRPGLHNEEAYIHFRPFKRLTLTVGGEDWGMWGGEGYSSDFEDYFRMVLGMAGGETATKGDQDNVLGNHVGRTLARIEWQGEGWKASVSKDSPFEDGSGIKQRNFPDGVWSAYLHRDGEGLWISDFILEYIYTRCQSGPLHMREATPEEMARQDPDSFTYGFVVLGGQDEYFNHMNYHSGWTHHGMTIGLPLILPQSKVNGVCPGIASNACEGIHLGVRGLLFRKYPYRFRYTFARHYGCPANYRPRFEDHPSQSSLGIDGSIPFQDIFRVNSPLDFTYGLYGDVCEYYKNNCTLMIGAKYTF